jgi:nucleotide-binding universal stress UspA family protein
MERIVVGVDGSPESKAALAWAGEEARLRGDRLVAVRVCTPRVVAPVPWPGVPVKIPAPVEIEEEAREALAADVEEVLGPDPDGKVEQRVVRGLADEALVDLACDAKLLVVGSRRHGRIAGAVLGSVSRECAQHAPCPVVIVRPNAARAAA